MKIDAGLFLSAIGLFVWLMSAWEALIQLSGGKARRIEAKNRALAKKVEEWVENKSAYETVFRFVVLLTVCFLAVSSFSFVKERFDAQPVHITAILMFVAALREDKLAGVNISHM